MYINKVPFWRQLTHQRSPALFPISISVFGSAMSVPTLHGHGVSRPGELAVAQRVEDRRSTTPKWAFSRYCLYGKLENGLKPSAAGHFSMGHHQVNPSFLLPGIWSINKLPRIPRPVFQLDIASSRSQPTILSLIPLRIPSPLSRPHSGVTSKSRTLRLSQ